MQVFPQRESVIHEQGCSYGFVACHHSRPIHKSASPKLKEAIIFIELVTEWIKSKANQNSQLHLKNIDVMAHPDENKVPTMLSRLLGLSQTDTFGSVLSRNRGAGPGFDAMRLGLAVLIFLGHAKWIAGGAALGVTMNPMAGVAGQIGDISGKTSNHWGDFTYPLKMALVPAFFSLGGFLVTGSALRLRYTSTFLAHRVLRIFPALAVEVLLSAFVFGAFLTTLPLKEYFTSPVFFRYLGNMVGHVSYVLPGVFENNLIGPVVNANLWTLPPDLYSYIWCTLMMLTGWMYNRKILTILVLLTGAGLAVMHALYNFSDGHPYPAHLIMFYFCLGSLAYHWRDRIPCNPTWFLPILLLTYILMMYPALRYVTSPLITWCTMFVGMIAFPRSKLLKSGDYSYGMYLYGFPICQALIAVVPWFQGKVVLFILVTSVLTALFSAFSWHVVEKHVLKLKRKLPENLFPTKPRTQEAEVAS